MVDIDSESLFNGAAAIVATIAVLYFILNVEWTYSPVSKVLLVVLFLTAIFALTQRTPDHQLTLLGYGVIVISAVALFFDVVSTFNVDDTLNVLGLLVIASLLFYLRTHLDEDNHFVSARQAKYALAVVAVLAVAVLVVDVASGGLTYELQPKSEVEITEKRHEQVRVGSIVAMNPTPLPERVETPRYAVCTGGNWSQYRRSDPDGETEPVRADVHVDDGYNEYVFGYSSKSYPVSLHINGANLQGETFPVKVTDACPDDESGSPYIALFEASEDHPYKRPV